MYVYNCFCVFIHIHYIISHALYLILADHFYLFSHVFIDSTYCVLDTLWIAGEKVGSTVHTSMEWFHLWGASDASLFRICFLFVCWVCVLCAYVFVYV